MSSDYHVIQVAPCYVDLNSETGGVANVVRQLCLRLRKKGYGVTLLCTNTELGKVVASPSWFVTSHGIRVCVVGQSVRPALGPASNTIIALKNLVGEIKVPNVIAHIHTCFNMQCEVSMRFFKEQSIPYVFSPHGKLSLGMLSKHRFLKMIWWRIRSRRLVNESSFIGILTNKESEMFNSIGVTSQTKTVPNGFDEEVPVASEKSISAPNDYIIYLGYLDPRKQPDFLIRAFAISDARKKCKLLLVGPDQYNYGSVLNDLVKKLGLVGSVIFWGAAYGAEKWALLRNARCLCLPSKGEGHPLVMCEALGAGTPSIYSVQCNFPEVARFDAGIQISNFDEREWASAIDEVIFNIKKRTQMSIAASDLAKKYTWEAAINKWEVVYKGCL